MAHKLDNIPITTNFAQALQKLRIEESEDIEFASQLFETAKKIAKPKVLYREVYVEEISGRNIRINGYDFESTVLVMQLKNTHRVFSYICTCGKEIDDWSHTEKDYVAYIWLDMIKEMFLDEASIFLRNHLITTYQFEKLSSVSPGSGSEGNWPISQQTQLFSMTGDVKEEIGVNLTDSFLMIPTKSVSGLLFPSEIEFMNCKLCEREICQRRNVEFDKELHDKIFIVN